jgi:predicted DNA-binding transcriptional regulator YafY
MKNEKTESRKQKSGDCGGGNAETLKTEMLRTEKLKGQMRLRTTDHGPRTTGAGHQSTKRPPLERMYRIYAWLRDGEYPNCGRITAEFEVDRKTALRDIAFMQDRMGLPIAYDYKRHGYFFKGPVPGFPGVPVTEKELFGLCVVHKTIEQYQGTALQQPLELLFQKVTGQLDDKERFTLQNLDEVLSFRPFAPDDPDLRLFELVSRAVTERRAVQFQYRKPGEKCAEARRVHPYHLMEFGNRWYLLAHDLKRDDIRTFVLGRMREPALTEERFARPKDFDPKKHFDQSFGVMAGTGDYEVVIEMDAWLTDILRGRRWHPKQVWTELPGGGSQLRLRLSCLEEIEQYVLSWGAHATVIGPGELRRRLFQTTEELRRRYGGES